MQAAKKLLEVCTKLRELGHPEYLSNEIKYTLHCSFSQEEADEMVRREKGDCISIV